MSNFTRTWIKYCNFLLIVAVLQTLPLQAQPSRPQQAERRPRALHPERQRQQNEHTISTNKFMRHWLQELQKSDPAQYEQARTMRQQDPHAFSQWMRERMQKRRRETILERHPALHEFLTALPTEEREQIEADLFRLRRPERQQQENQQSEAESNHTRSGRQKEIDHSQFDAQTRHFEREIERAEKRLEHLKHLLEQRKKLRDTLPES